MDHKLFLAHTCQSAFKKKFPKISALKISDIVHNIYWNQLYNT